MPNRRAFSQILFLVLIAALLQTCIAKSYNVLDFGAMADGKTDSSSAFVKAWTIACNHSSEESTVLVPQGTFMVNTLEFNGSCKYKMHLKILGNLVAPDSYESLRNHEAWIAFYYVDGLSVIGGTIDAKGLSYWSCKKEGKGCPFGARYFLSNDWNYYDCSPSLSKVVDIEISGLTSMNSEAVHVFINGCNNITMRNLTIMAPGDSPNTDGIHIGNSNVIRVLHSHIGTGDDCISIGPGTRHMSMNHITCGPGHGISIGSMGGGPNEDGVEHISVNNSIFSSTDNGVRIKTWAKPSNTYARNIVFANLEMQNVANPIIIDQEYCPARNCTKASSGVKVSNVTYSNIRGTSRSQEALALICSSTKPCEIKLQNINISYIDESRKIHPATSLCQNSKVTNAGVVIPCC